MFFCTYSYICDVYYSISYWKVIVVFFIIWVIVVSMVNNSRIGRKNYYKKGLMREREEDHYERGLMREREV